MLKEIFAQKIVKSRLLEVGHIQTTDRIRTVGILFDEETFTAGKILFGELSNQGLDPSNIGFIVYKEKASNGVSIGYPSFSLDNINWNANLRGGDIKRFVNTPFDLLINYYREPKSALLAASNLSAAKFKAGISSGEQKINHLLIDTAANRHLEFTSELFRYLKILKKI